MGPIEYFFVLTAFFLGILLPLCCVSSAKDNLKEQKIKLQQLRHELGMDEGDSEDEEGGDMD